MSFLETLRGEKMPVWLTLVWSLLAAIVGGVGTYFLAPAINSGFESQQAHAQYIMDNLKALNDDTARVFGLVAQINQALEDNHEIRRETLDEIRSDFTKLQWRANEYETLFTDSTSRLTIGAYSKSLSEIEEKIVAAHRSSDVTGITMAGGQLAITSRQLIKMLSTHTRWSASFDLSLHVFHVAQAES